MDYKFFSLMQENNFDETRPLVIEDLKLKHESISKNLCSFISLVLGYTFIFYLSKMRPCLWLVPLTVVMDGRRDHVTEKQKFSFKQKSKNSQNWSLHFWERFSRTWKSESSHLTPTDEVHSFRKAGTVGVKAFLNCKTTFPALQTWVILTLLKLLTLLAIWRAQKTIWLWGTTDSRASGVEKPKF